MHDMAVRVLEEAVNSAGDRLLLATSWATLQHDEVANRHWLAHVDAQMTREQLLAGRLAQ